MRDYQRRTGKYKVSRTVYHQALWYIRDYYRLKENLNSISTLSPILVDDMPKSQTNKTSDKVFSLVMKREKYADKIRIIERAFRLIPEEYRKGVWNNIHFNKCFPMDAHRVTYSNYKSKVIYLVAKELNLL